MQKHLLFVYNADSGLFNTLTDIAHKILSPNTYRCKLCALTHGHFRARQTWVAFLAELPARCDFLHRDEFRRLHGMNDTDLPAVFLHGDGARSVLISAREIAACTDLPTLKALIEQRLAALD